MKAGNHLISIEKANKRSNLLYHIFTLYVKWNTNKEKRKNLPFTLYIIFYGVQYDKISFQHYRLRSLTSIVVKKTTSLFVVVVNKTMK